MIPVETLDPMVLTACEAFDLLDDAVIMTDADLTQGPNIIWANRSFLVRSGYDLDEILGRSPRMFHGTDTCPDAVGRIRQAIQAEDAFVGDLVNYTRDGRPFVCELTIRPFRDPDGTLLGFLGVNRDVTDQRANQKLHEKARIRESQTQAIADLGRDALSDTLEVPRFFNTVCERIAGGLNVPFTAVFCRSEDHQTFRLLAHYGFDGISEADADRLAEISSELAPEDQDLREIRDVPEHPDYELFHRLGIRSGVLVEIPATQGPWGDLAVYAASRRRLSKQDRLFLRSISNLAADAIRRRTFEEELERSRAKYRAVVEDQTELICRFSPDFTLTFVNTAYARFAGRPAETLIGTSYTAGLSAEVVESIRRAVSGLTPDRPVVTGTRRVESGDGTLWHTWSHRAIFGPRNEIVELQSIGRDITAEQAAKERIEFLAHHDILTGLANRVVFADRLEEQMALADRLDARIAVLYMDLDKFKTINDTLGHHVGDRLLCEIAKRLLETSRRSDLVARLGGDEFAILMTMDRGRSWFEATRLAQRVLDHVNRVVDIDGVQIHPTISVGVALYPDNGLSREEIMQAADMAMYRAKAEGRNRYHFFDNSLKDWVTHRKDVEDSLRHAIERDEFEVWYQPKVDMASGHLIGVEALVRWRLGGKIVSPAEFIPIAEETGDIREIDFLVAERACRFAADLRDRGVDIQVSVNISPSHFRIYQDFAGRVRAILEASGLPPENLMLEIVETMTLPSAEHVLSAMYACRAMGVRFSVDDFGTGYASLNYLRTLPVSEIKIDQSFVKNLLSDETDETLVRSIINLARNLNMAVVAEGVRSDAHAAFLLREGCTVGQGELYGMPMPEADLRRLTEGGSEGPQDGLGEIVADGLQDGG
jgi:diguanylate cyclase (GGDEF)-like protein/PAS domain S-box-containing protein